jgi:ElaB/YqjD/DUF883 family membrane-anchored ribosome-binding protein
MAEPNEMAPSQSSLGSNVPSAQEPSKADELREAAHETRDQIRERSQELSTHAQEVASEYYQLGREKAQEWEQTLEAQIREKPIQSLLIAGGIGLFLGLLWRR